MVQIITLHPIKNVSVVVKALVVGWLISPWLLLYERKRSSSGALILMPPMGPISWAGFMCTCLYLATPSSISHRKGAWMGTINEFRRYKDCVYWFFHDCGVWLAHGVVPVKTRDLSNVRVGGTKWSPKWVAMIRVLICWGLAVMWFEIKSHTQTNSGTKLKRFWHYFALCSSTNWWWLYSWMNV